MRPKPANGTNSNQTIEETLDFKLKHIKRLRIDNIQEILQLFSTEILSVQGTPWRALTISTLISFIGLSTSSLTNPILIQMDKEHMPEQYTYLLKVIPILAGSFFCVKNASAPDVARGNSTIQNSLLLSNVGVFGLWALTKATNISTITPNSLAYILLLVSAGLSGAGISMFSGSITNVTYWYPKADSGAIRAYLAGVSALGPLFSILPAPQLIEYTSLSGIYFIYSSLLIITSSIILKNLG